MIKNPRQYLGRIAPEVAKELGMEIDAFLDDLFDSDYYHCPKCGQIVNLDEQDWDIDKPCEICKARKKLIGRNSPEVFKEKGYADNLEELQEYLTYIDSLSCSVCTNCSCIVDMNDIKDKYFCKRCS